jgi:hypothetical protein
MRTRETKKRRFQVEFLEDRIAPGGGSFALSETGHAKGGGVLVPANAERHGAGALSAIAAHDANSRVFPVKARPRGLSYGEWLARSGQWAFSLPQDAHPLFDTADCSAGQSGKVWFLAGTVGVDVAPGVILQEAHRSCTIPSGTALFVPILSGFGATIQGVDSLTDEELRAGAKAGGDAILPESLRLVIDGRSVTDLQDFRVQSPVFTFGPLPENNIFGAPAGATGRAVIDGYAAMLKPLPVGTHTIQFAATVVDQSAGITVIEDISYTITVVPRGRYHHQGMHGGPAAGRK